MKKNIIAIITARAGSKGLPRKNVLSLHGKPLISHTIQAAIDSKIFTDIVVTTDDKEIKDISLSYKIRVIDRPAKLASDTASSLDVILHTLETLGKGKYNNADFILLQPTSPLRTYLHIKEAWNQYSSKKACSLVSITEEGHTPYKLLQNNNEQLEPLFGYKYLSMPRQKLPKTYRINGAIYITSCNNFIKTKNIFLQPSEYFMMDSISSLDIDSKLDFDFVEFLLKNKMV